MSFKLYVGNLAFQADEASLRQLFEQFGQVKSVKVVSDHETGRSRGFAFVEMENEAEGKASIEGLNEKEAFGRTLRVSEARAKEERGGGRGGRGDFREHREHRDNREHRGGGGGYGGRSHSDRDHRGGGGGYGGGGHKKRYSDEG